MRFAELVAEMMREDLKAAERDELVKKHALLSAPFSVESGEITPTLKVKRKVVKDKYRDVLASLR